jgi:hypothetical protein
VDHHNYRPRGDDDGGGNHRKKRHPLISDDGEYDSPEMCSRSDRSGKN